MHQLLTVSAPSGLYLGLRPQQDSHDSFKHNTCSLPHMCTPKLQMISSVNLTAAKPRLTLPISLETVSENLLTKLATKPT